MRPIDPVARQDIEDRTGTAVSVWRRRSSKEGNGRQQSSDFLRSGSDQALVSHVKRVIGSAKSTLMISCSQVGREIAPDLVAAANRNVRIYLLLTESGFKGWVDRPLDQLPDLCLCRRSSSGIPSLILADAERGNQHPSDGLLLSPGAPLNLALSEGDGLWGLALSPLQIQKMAELFSWLFWRVKGDRSETRALGQMNSPVAAQVPEGAVLRPFANNQMIQIESGVGESQIWHGLDSLSGIAAFGLNADALRDFLGQELRSNLRSACLPSPEEVNSKGEVFAGGCPGDFAFIVDTQGNTGWLFDWIADPDLLAGHSTVLRLTSRQANALAGEYRTLVQRTEYVLGRNVPVGDLGDGEIVLRYPGGERVAVESERSIDLGSVRVDPWWNGQMETYALPVSRRPEIDGIVQRVKWVWRNHAASVPESARLSPDEIKMKDVQAAAAGAMRRLLQEHEKLGNPESAALEELGQSFDDPDVPVRTAANMRRILSQLAAAKAEIDEQAKATGDESELSAVRGKKKKGKIKIPNADNLPTVDLPKAGRLFWNSGENYLVVEDWDDVPVAVAEAERLNAALCVPRKSKAKGEIKSESTGGHNA